MVPEVVLRRQIDAVLRVLSLFPGKKMTVHDAIGVLAGAEDEAQFVCGFIDLNQYNDEKELIVEAAIARGFISVDENGHMTLTPAGQDKGQTKLPEPIEQILRERK